MNTEINMGKLNDWLESVRNTFINASELANKVGALQVQVNEMTQSLEGLRALNRTLDENLSWSRSERDRLDTALRDTDSTLQSVIKEKQQAQSDLDYWKKAADERMGIIATLRSDNDTIAFRNLELEEENGKLKATVDAINKALHPLNTIAETKPANDNVPMSQASVSEPVKTVEPFVHPVTGVVQGRDPETKQFVPISESGKASEPVNKPWWEDQPKEGSGSF